MIVKLTAEQREKLSGIAKHLTYSAKGGCYIAKHKYFYTFGYDEEKFAAAIKRVLPAVTIVETSNHWNAWPKDSWFEVRFKLESAEEVRL